MKVHVWEIGNVDETAAIWVERKAGRKTMIGMVKDGLTDAEAAQLASEIARGGKAYSEACAAVKEWQPERPDGEDCLYAIIKAAIE